MARRPILVALAATLALLLAPGVAAQEEDLLDTIRARGQVIIPTDAAYPPQSELLPDGSLQGFDIDVGEEIARRLGVTVSWQPVDWKVVDAAAWAGRFDMSVGSMTITEPRQGVFDFSPPYYYTPAQMAATVSSGITTLDGLAGKTVCTGEQTTYYSWLTGSLVLVGSPEPASPPPGVMSKTFGTDTDCAEAVLSGRAEFEAWLSSSTTVANAMANDAPFVLVGEPVFYEALAVSFDKAGPPHDALLAEVSRIVEEMHADGTLSALSRKWFAGLDLTTVASEQASPAPEASPA